MPLADPHTGAVQRDMRTWCALEHLLEGIRFFGVVETRTERRMLWTTRYSHDVTCGLSTPVSQRRAVALRTLIPSQRTTHTPPPHRSIVKHTQL